MTNLKEQVAREAQAKKLIENERYRQITAEGWTAEHDDAHQEGELLRASVAYYVAAKHGGEFVENAYNWPWDKKWWKPKSPRRNLEIAGALALAERDRLKRKHGHAANTGPADHKYEQAVKLLTALLHPEGSSADVVERAKPVAWRCKDFGDGWIVYQYKEHADRYQKETGCLMQPLFASAQPSNARERALEEALKRIATDDCGCTPICQCNSESALRVWKEETQQIAKAALRTPDVERPASPVPAGEDEAAWKAFGASEAACIHYPDDTELDRACRAAYIRGAADSAPSLPEWKSIETAPKDGTKIDLLQRGKRVTDAYWSAVEERWCVDGYYGLEEPTPLSASPVTHWMPLPAAPTGEE